MEETLKILDKLDRKENVYFLIKRYANYAHQIMKNNSMSNSGDMGEVVRITLKKILEDTDK
jgi:hypothetical protein